MRNSRLRHRLDLLGHVHRGSAPRPCSTLRDRRSCRTRILRRPVGRQPAPSGQGTCQRTGRTAFSATRRVSGHLRDLRCRRHSARCAHPTQGECLPFNLSPPASVIQGRGAREGRMRWRSGGSRHLLRWQDLASVGDYAAPPGPSGEPRYLPRGPRVGTPGCWVRHDLLPLSSMIRGVLSPGSGGVGGSLIGTWPTNLWVSS